MNHPKHDVKLLDDSEELSTETEALEIALLNRQPKEIFILEISLKIGKLTIEQGTKFRTLLLEFADLFAKDITKLDRTNLVIYKIFTEDVPSISFRSYMVPLTEQKIINKKIQKMIDNKLIQESSSP